MEDKPDSKIDISGKVKRIGKRKNTPVMKPIGIEYTIARGSCLEGLWTSSAILVTVQWIRSYLDPVIETKTHSSRWQSTYRLIKY